MSEGRLLGLLAVSHVARGLLMAIACLLPILVNPHLLLSQCLLLLLLKLRLLRESLHANLCLLPILLLLALTADKAEARRTVK
jgi:hypothetical protein